MKDSDFVNQFSTVLGILVLIAVGIYVLANALSEEYTMSASEQRIVEARLAPVGKVHVGEVAMTDATSPAGEAANAAGAATDDSPEAVYKKACASCHASGVLNSPIYGDKAAWAERKQDVDALYESAINGKGQMPAKGGRADLSDETIRRVVDYMLEAV